jgi:hypothetical protein
VSVFANEVPKVYRLTVATVLAWLTSQGRLQEAWLYNRLVWDWAEGVEKRPNGYFADLLGLHRHTIKASLEKLVATGLVSVAKVDSRQFVMLNLEGAFRCMFGENFDTVEKSGVIHNVENFDKLDDLAKVWDVPASFAVRPLSGCYVTIYDSGTLLALNTTVYSNTTVYGFIKHVYSSKNYNTNTVVYVENFDFGENFDGVVKQTSGGLAPPASKKKGRKRKSPGQSVVPKTSHDFPLAQAAEDSWWGTIEALHAEWCSTLGLEYPMTTFRYAAWRLALVESGYKPEQILSALPALKQDRWWVEKCGDPHVMFASNASKIERFFPANVKAVPDRLGRGATSTNESFQF